MATISQRHHGRLIRKLRRAYGPTAMVAVVRILPDTRQFELNIHWFMDELERLRPRRRQILHNGRKPR